MRGTEVSEFIDLAYTWQERATKAEAEVERLKKVYATTNDSWKKLQAENIKLRAVVEAAKKLVTQINNRTKTMGLDMSNYHAISITVKPGDAGRDYWEAVWAFEQALAELDKEGE